VRDALAQGTALVVEHDGRISGYATDLAFFAHAVGESNEDLEALIMAAEAFGGPGILVPTTNGELFRWCLASGLRVVQPMTLMAVGLYTPPQGAYLPAILYRSARAGHTRAPGRLPGRAHPRPPIAAAPDPTGQTTRGWGRPGRAGIVRAGRCDAMLRVSVLGDEAIIDRASGTVRSRSWRTIALVAILVARAGVPQSRQRLAGAFWPDSTATQALTNLRRELHELRHVLGDEASLVVTSKDLCWRDTATCQVDLRCFASARASALAASRSGDSARAAGYASAALEHYGGEFLPGRDEDWVLHVRSELDDQCVELCDVLRAARAGTGDLAGALDVARRRTRLRPLEEVGYRAVMELQADIGDRAGAVSTYHHCASVLERELGVEPDPATHRVVQRLLAGERRGGGAPPPHGRQGGTRLVGRRRELALLDGTWHAARAGPRLAIVRGGAGVGKTRLVAEFADQARAHGAVVAGTRCFGTAGSLALAPVADWLSHPVLRSAAARLDPVWRAEVERLAPAGPGRGGPAGGPRALVDAWQRHRFFDGLARALTGVGRPLLLVLDNAQWCDQETLAFLTFTLGRACDAPLMFAVTLRDDEPVPEEVLAAWTGRMRATGLLTELALSPLEAADTARLAAAVSGRAVGTRRGRCCRRRRAGSRCTSSRRCAAPSISVSPGSRTGTSPRCCRVVSGT
jgi:DNA-binding SARP family transcriptional activator